MEGLREQSRGPRVSWMCAVAPVHVCRLKPPQCVRTVLSPRLLSPERKVVVFLN